MRRIAVATTLVVVSLLGAGLATAPAQAGSTGRTATQTGRVVSQEPAANTPDILDGTVYSMTQVGNQIVVGGSFTRVRNHGRATVFTRQHAFSFDATSGLVSGSFRPNPNGTVYKVQAASDNTSVYVGGHFTRAGGRVVSNLFKQDVRRAVPTAGFRPPALDGDVRDLEVVGSRLWVAGKFAHLGARVQRALGTVNAGTGAFDGYFRGTFAGLHNRRVAHAVTDVLQISSNPANTELVAVGNFTTVNGQSRSQIVKLGVGGTRYALSPWQTRLYTSPCAATFDTYMSDVEYAPSGSYFVVSTSGTYGGAAESNAGTSGCDVVARFEDGDTGAATPTWTSYTGGDSTWTVEVTDDVVYAGGHQRWQNNPAARDAAGPGAVARTGIAALDPVNGMAFSWNPTRTRGVGVQDLLANGRGLYVGSDTTSIGRTSGNTYHPRIARLPVTGGTAVQQPPAHTLAGAVYTVAVGSSQLVRRDFDGSSVHSSANAPTGPGWSTTVGAFMVRGRLYTATADGVLHRRSFDGVGYGAPTTVNAADAIVPQADWHGADVPALTSLFYDHGQIFYTRSGDDTLYRRAFEVQDDIVGQQRFASGRVTGFDLSAVRGAFVADQKLWLSDSAGRLFRAGWTGTAPVASSAVQVSGPGQDGQTWDSRAMFVYQGDPQQAPDADPVARATVSCARLDCSFDARASSDSDGTVDSYDWDFGDGSAHGTGATTRHTYADPGDRTVTLTVTDDRGHTAQTTRTVSPSATTSSTLAPVGAVSTNGARTTHAVTIPAGVQAGDTLLLFFTANSVTPTYTGPSGWTLVRSQNGTATATRAWAKVAAAGDAGMSVRVTSSGTAVKSDVTVAAYRGASSSAPVATSAVRTDNAATSSHVSPDVSATGNTQWLVTFWADKSNATTAWTAPADQTTRSTSYGTGTSHVSALLTDSGGPVPAGPVGGLTATADSSGTGASVSVLLSSS